MKKSTKIALGFGAGAVACTALAVHFWRKRQTRKSVACGVVGGCAAAAAAGCAVCALRKRDTPRLEYRETPLLTKLDDTRLAESAGNPSEVQQNGMTSPDANQSPPLLPAALAEVRDGIATPVGETFFDLKVSSPWGRRESFSTTGGNTLPDHNGMDFAAKAGTRINAVMDGWIAKVAFDAGYGKYVEIVHANGTHTLYGHQSRIIVQEGQKVQAGEKIGEVGSTGKSTGPHLHFGYDGDGDGFYSRTDVNDNPARLLYGGGGNQ